MSTTEHPITPPPELVQQWLNEWPHQPEPNGWVHQYIATQAARWGADMELDACVEWVINTRAYDMTPSALRAARRPKPPTLKEQALEALDSATYQPGTDFKQIDPTRSAILRRALEQLDD